MTTRRRVRVQVNRHVETRAIVGCEDMVLLPTLSEDGVVANVRARLEAEQIYTNIGHVLVACNPYKWLNIYGEDSIKKYVHQQRVDVAPHIFSTAEAAYRAMITEEENQCVIISGESGAGKTEASKQIQSYIAAVCGGGEDVDKIKGIFLESNPVLEAFGNAKTLRNNNSSRFGKYFELKFNRFGSPLGGVVTNYLLEKSRISRPGNGERNFHIFYHLLASEYVGALKLGKPDSFAYLSCSSAYTVDGVSDKEEGKITLEAMRSVGMTTKQIQSILKLVAAVLHLGNVTFQSKQVEGVEGCAVKSGDGAMANFCELAGLDASIVEQVLTYRELQSMAAGGKVDVYQVPQSAVQASARRDSLAKAIYSSLFDLIVSRINVALDVNNSNSRGGDEDDPDSMLSISVLDIYGFEVFEKNGFEQLCINYVNEKLQQIFIELTLRAEQDEYAREGIAWKPIPFFNNKVVCDLLDGAKPSGVFRILDDTCKTMHGTKDGLEVDRKFVETCSQCYSSHAHFASHSGGFIVKHYAGDVTYNVGKLGESNKDALNNDLLLVIKSTTDKLLGHLFQEEVDPNDKKAAPTAGTKIRGQCGALVAALTECTPHYVRCIKSNDSKAALRVDALRVKHQVKYLGLVENIKVRRAGFAYRADYHRFLERFCMLSKETYPEWKGADKDGCRAILKAVAISGQLPGLNKEEAQLGKTKIFVRQPETYFGLERMLEVRRGDFVARIQRAWRKYITSKDMVLASNAMAKLYRQMGKSRRRDSIFRPYSSDYLTELDPSLVESVREGLFRLVDYYDETENVIFVDSTCGAVVKAAAGSSSSKNAGGWDVEKMMIAVTNKALYLCNINLVAPEFTPAPKSGKRGGARQQQQQQHPPPPPPSAAKKLDDHRLKPLPPVTLRRRILLGGHERGSSKRQLVVLQGLSLSKLADESLVIKTKPQAVLASPSIGHWAPDNTQETCTATGERFTLFNRRHHCRVCGSLFVDRACDVLQPIPDLGHYCAVRVCDGCVGVESTDGCEDVLLLAARRTEIVCAIQQAYTKLTGSDLSINFQNSARLDTQSCPAAISRSPAPEVVFTDAAKTAALIKGFTVSVNMNGPKIVVAAPPGLPHDVVEEKQRRAAARRKRAAEKRRLVDAERQARAAAREQAREQERLSRLAEKKARKAAEREAKRAETSQGGGAAPCVFSAPGVPGAKSSVPARQFGAKDQHKAGAGGATSSAGGAPVSELAAKLAKRRAAE